MAEAQVFGEAPVLVVAFEKRGIILVEHELDGLLVGGIRGKVPVVG